MTRYNVWTLEQILSASENELAEHLAEVIQWQYADGATCGGRIMMPYESEADYDDVKWEEHGKLSSMSKSEMCAYMCQYHLGSEYGGDDPEAGAWAAAAAM